MDGPYEWIPFVASTKSNSRAEEVLASRLRKDLRKDLLPFANKFVTICNVGTPLVVSTRHKIGDPSPFSSLELMDVVGCEPGAEFSEETARRYSSSEAEHYTILEEACAWGNMRDLPLENNRFAEEMTVESDPVELGALTYNHCISAAYLFWLKLSDRYQNEPHIHRVEWAYVSVRPRKVFVWERELGKESHYDHDIIIIHTTNGLKFVFDPSVYQFGFGDYFHEWTAYEEQFIMGNPRQRNPWVEISVYDNHTDPDSRLMQQARAELMR